MSTDDIPARSNLFTVRARPRPVSALGAVGTLAWRAMLKIKHVPFQLFDVTITPIMFTLLFTYMFGGALAGDLFRYTVASILIIVIGVLLGFRPGAGPFGVLAAFGLVLVFAFALSWIWIIFGMIVQTPESVMTTSFLFLMPLTFASNIFVGLETMPSWLQAVVRHNPVTHLANASRGLMHGHDVTSDILWVLVASAAIVLVAAPVALRMYHRER